MRVESINMPTNSDYIMEITVTHLDTGISCKKRLFHNAKTNKIKYEDNITQIKAEKDAFRKNISILNNKMKSLENKTYDCQCLCCDRIFTYTFKNGNIKKLKVNENGYIIWKCHSCFYKTRENKKLTQEDRIDNYQNEQENNND